jgi:hypothetical protein
MARAPSPSIVGRRESKLDEIFLIWLAAGTSLPICLPGQQAAPSLQQPMRHRSIIAHHDPVRITKSEASDRLK